MSKTVKHKKGATCRGSSNIHRNLLENHLFINNEDPKLFQRKVIDMIIELDEKYSLLESKVDEINKWVVKKKKNVNIVDWLNKNVVPWVEFDKMIDSIVIQEEDVVSLFNNTFNEVLIDVLERTVCSERVQEKKPIFAFVQKINTFYVYNEDARWVELDDKNMIKFLNKIRNKIFATFYEWKKKKRVNGMSEKMETTCDETTVKIMGHDFNKESVLNKIKKHLFGAMKTEIKVQIEYDFDF